ncbi:gastrula zinc finger protein XlCGF8.2DB isoform X1 [Bombina bombina]|uniref:gastrula zinc finger protein XlCGF8.2DB isoform X1 n=1 Tax=Bombina bombina TaxID=8345 RepID=UPI00235AC4AA|nr:gastrula zinc finger protein XlCGF8.2DB isoform X1 [Bombina bombina]XP_053567262.1 gastrula zinc finger protein XlCGF8.2DB isoform X1 [Bombina bombina]
MNKMKKKLPEQILNHILEILYLLTGERVTNSLTASDMTGDKMTTERILTHTLQIMYLLTGECCVFQVPIKRDDVAVYFSMEEWEYIEGHKELYKDVMMETHQALRTMEIPGNESSGENDVKISCNTEQTEDQWQRNMPDAAEQEICDNISTGEFTNCNNPSHDQSADASLHLQNQRSHVGNLCSDCGKCFLKKSHLLKHLKIHRGENPFSCPICGKFFNHKRNLVAHQKIHTGEKGFSCSNCGKCFNQKSNLITHQKIHTGEKGFLCSDCGKCFNQKTHLLSHQKIHIGEKGFLCSDCGKCFTHKSNLIRHQKIHTGEKAFSCSDCGKCFALKSTLLSHLKIHTGEKGFSCSKCGKCFTQKTLIRHQKTHIKIN